MRKILWLYGLMVLMLSGCSEYEVATSEELMQSSINLEENSIHINIYIVKINEKLYQELDKSKDSIRVMQLKEKSQYIKQQIIDFKKELLVNFLSDSYRISEEVVIIPEDNNWINGYSPYKLKWFPVDAIPKDIAELIISDYFLKHSTNKINKAEFLKDRIVNYKKQIRELFVKESSEIEDILNFYDVYNIHLKEVQTWEYYNFNQISVLHSVILFDDLVQGIELMENSILTNLLIAQQSN